MAQPEISNLDQLTNVIHKILSSDNTEREINEGYLRTARTLDLNSYVRLFCSAITDSDKPEVRIFAIVHLRRLLSNFDDHNDQTYWQFLSPPTQEDIKKSLLDAFRQQTNLREAKPLAELIGGIDATIREFKSTIFQGPTQWPELMQAISDVISSDNTNLIQSGFTVLCTLFLLSANDYHPYHTELFGLLNKGLNHANLHVKASAIEALFKFIESADPKNCKAFEGLLPTVIDSLALIVKEDDEELVRTMLESMMDVIEAEPRFFRKHIPQLFDILKAASRNSQLPSDIHTLALDVVVVLVERLPKSFSGNTQLLTTIFETYLNYMVANSEEPNEQWLSPHEGFQADDEDDEDNEARDEVIESFMAKIDQIISSLEKPTTLPVLGTIVLKMIKSNNWKEQYSGIMICSQMGEFVEDISTLNFIMPDIFKSIESTHAKVRYAVIHCIGQFAADSDDFISVHLKKSMDVLKTTFNDSVPRVVAHALAAVGNLLDHAQVNQVKPYIHSILEVSTKVLESGISLAKENALIAISGLTGTLEEEFAPYFQMTAEKILDVLKNSHKKEEKLIRGRCIECLTIMSDVGTDEFLKIAPGLIQKMTDIQKNDITKNDPQRFFLLGGWERICKTLKQNFTPYMKDIAESLFDMIDVMITEFEEQSKVLKGEVDDEDSGSKKALGSGHTDKKKGMDGGEKPSSADDAVVCVEMLSRFLDTLGKEFLPYLDRASETLVMIVERGTEDSGKFEAAEGLLKVIECIQKSEDPDKISKVHSQIKRYTQIIMSCVEQEFDPSNIKRLVITINDVITLGDRCMTQEEIEGFGQRIFNFIRESVDRRAEEQDMLDAQNEDGDEADEEIEQAGQDEDHLQCALADLIGTLFKFHNELTLPIVETIQKHFLPKALSSPAPGSRRFGLYLIDNMIEFLDFEHLVSKWKVYAQVLSTHSTHSDASVRQTAVYGIGVLAEKSGAAFSQVLEPCLKALKDSAELKQGDTEDNEPHMHAKDNAIAAMGKIVKTQLNNITFNAISTWVNLLPLKHDRDEARLQHALFADVILDSNVNRIAGEQGENVAKIVKIIAEVLDTKLVDNKFEEKAGEIIQELLSNDAFRPTIDQAINSLKNKKKERMQQFIVMDD